MYFFSAELETCAFSVYTKKEITPERHQASSAPFLFSIVFEGLGGEPQSAPSEAPSRFARRLKPQSCRRPTLGPWSSHPWATKAADKGARPTPKRHPSLPSSPPGFASPEEEALPAAKWSGLDFLPAVSLLFTFSSRTSRFTRSTSPFLQASNSSRVGSVAVAAARPPQHDDGASCSASLKAPTAPPPPAPRRPAMLRRAAAESFARQSPRRARSGWSERERGGGGGDEATHEKEGGGQQAKESKRKRKRASGRD